MMEALCRFLDGGPDPIAMDRCQYCNVSVRAEALAKVMLMRILERSEPPLEAAVAGLERDSHSHENPTQDSRLEDYQKMDTVEHRVLWRGHVLW